MEVLPILRAMRRNKTGAILVALQIAIAVAIVTNATFIVGQRLQKIGRPAGTDTKNLVFVQSDGFAPQYNHHVTVREDLDLLRALPGVIAAAPISFEPLSGSGGSNPYKAKPEPSAPEVAANYYFVDEHGLDALGVKLLAGRTFSHDIVEYSTGNSSGWTPEVIVTRAMANTLFGTDEAVGRKVYNQLGEGATVVGVMDRMLGAWVGWDNLSHVALHPLVGSGPRVRYVVRTAPGQRDALIPDIELRLIESNPGRVVSSVKAHEDSIKRSYKSDWRMAILLTALVALLLMLTTLGIVGLASFNVTARTKQIGTRRALGARRIDILRHFMLENWLLTTGGALIGTLLSIAVAFWMSAAFGLPKLGADYVMACIFGMWLVGQSAVLFPALRAASVPPSVATRTI